MKLSSETLEILTGISRLNAKSPINGAVFKKGNVIKARRYKSTMPVMYATIEEEFPKDFAVFDLPRFIAMFNMMGNPEITFDDTNILLKAGRKRAKLRYISEHLIEPDENFFARTIKMPSVDFSFDLDKDTLKSVMDATSMFQAPQISISGDGENVVLTTYNVKDPKADKLEIEIGESDWEFNIILDMENLHFLRRDYTISLSKKGILEWKSGDLTYYITCSDKSKV